MMLDNFDKLLDAYAPTSTGTTYQKYIDRLVQMEDGAGEPIYIFGQVSASATSSGSATVQFKVVGNPTDNTFTSGNETLFDSGAITYTSLIKGYLFCRAVIPRQPSSNPEVTGTLYRYISCAVIIGTAALTAGTFDMWLTPKPLQDMVSYPRGYTV